MEAYKSPHFNPVDMKKVYNRNISKLTLDDCTSQALTQKNIFPVGNKIFMGIPFVLGAESENQNNVLVLKNSEARLEMPKVSHDKYVVVLHAADYKTESPMPDGIHSPMKGAPLLGDLAGEYAFKYADGTAHIFKVKRRFSIGEISRDWGEGCFEPSILSKVYAAALESEASEEKKMFERMQELLKEQNGLREKILKSNDAELFELKHQLNAVENEIAELEKTLAAIRECRVSNRDITDSFESLDALWEELFPVERYRLARLLIEKIEVTRKSLKMEIKTHGVRSLVKELQSGNPENFRAKGQDAQTVSIEIPVMVKYKKGRKVIVAPDSEITESQTPVQETLFQALTRAHSWLELIESGEVTTITQLAEKLNLDKSYVGKIFRLINLAPDIQEMLIRGIEPDGLTLQQLRGTIPSDWNEQRQIFGISVNS